MKAWLRGLLGRLGERQAASYLTGLGYKIVGHGISNRFGEIDLIAIDGETLVFVEVRTRRSLDAGHPAETVAAGKQDRLTRAALSFLKRNNLLERRSRFDVVAVIWPDDGDAVTIEHYKNAFEPTGSGRFFG